MRRRRLIVLSVGLGISCVALAFGPATHAWLARRITGESSPAVLYGSTAPDLSEFASEVLGDDDLHSAMRHLTHREFELLRPSAFAEGFATHNGTWGADAYAHGYRDAETQEWVEGYVAARATQLQNETGLSAAYASTYIEAAVDVLVRRDFGRGEGRGLLRAALLAGMSPARDIVDAFAGPLADEMEGMSEREAERMLRISHGAIRVGVAVYGSQLAKSESYLMTVVPLALSLYDGSDFATASLRFGRALQLCEDYEAELERIVPLIAAEMPAKQGVD
ncbi:MAG: hypothetical protein JXR94_23585 [Candidatus Hydrogenedentes bacterium]|nr:hypothetical protein [Candidatus Hydrogenedentota bacterium]